MYVSQHNEILSVSHDGESRLAARAGNAHGAARAVFLLNRARDLNDRQRKYTAAARAIAEAEGIKGFAWVEGDTTP